MIILILNLLKLIIIFYHLPVGKSKTFLQFKYYKIQIPYFYIEISNGIYFVLNHNYYI